jgi:ABC-type nitrate/sulfonate/bicarbonate transport system substrate-binding protein
MIWILNDQFAGEIYSHYKGWYKKENIDLVLLPYQRGTSDPYDSIMTGKADIGIYETSSLLRRAIKDKADIVIFGIEDQISPAGFMSMANKGIKQPKDLEGHVFGYYNDGDIDLFRWFANKNNVSLATIEMHNVVPNDMDPLINGKVDFIVAHETNEPVIMKLKGYDTNFIPLSGPWGYQFGTSFFCKRNYYEKHKDILNSFMKATAKGWRATFANPREAAEIILNNYYKGDYIDNSRKTTIDKFIKGLGIKSYYITFKVGPDCINCMSKTYWNILRDRLILDGIIASGDDIQHFIRFDATQSLMKSVE